MAQNRTYSALEDEIEALAGVDSFTTGERARLLVLANRRLYEAYRACETWPRYFVHAQARPAPDGVIPSSYDESAGIRTGSSATRSGSTVTIVCTAAVDVIAGMEVTVSGLSGTVSPNITATLTGVSRTTVDNDTITYEVDTELTTTETYTGTATVTPVAIDDMDSVIRTWDGSPRSAAHAREFDFVAESGGWTPIQGSLGYEGFWVQYKKQWDGPYLSTATAIPREFFSYAAQAVYADFLRMEGQNDRALAEEQVAGAILSLEVSKAENAMNNTAYRSIKTHGSTQSR